MGVFGVGGVTGITNVFFPGAVIGFLFCGEVREIGVCFRLSGFIDVVRVTWDSDGSQDADDGNDDHEFDERETAIFIVHN